MNRVVITGMGVAAPNAVGLEAFEKAIREGESGIRFFKELEELNFSCQIGGKPEVPAEMLEKYFTPLQLRGLNSSGIIYGVIAGMDAWKDAALEPSPEGEVLYDSGIIFGTGILGVDKFREAIHLIDAGKTRRLGSTSVIQTMASGISAYLGGILGCGNQVTTNSSACTTGTEAVLMAYERIKAGKAKRMLAGSCGDHGPYVWGGFDAMRILPGKYNLDPQIASRPMSASATGFVPGSGAGALVLEDYDLAIERGAKIYAEVLGGEMNSGGQRAGGSMTAANSEAVQRCITAALQNSGIAARDVDLINGHLTATTRDSVEIKNWVEALEREGDDFPYINSLKGMTGHCLSASGSIECVASVLQLKNNFIFGNINCEDLHPDIQSLISDKKVPRSTIQSNGEMEILAKASFGFGDVNAVVVFKRI
ncbi:beta-ketoacyl-[acyl-carrier-protein] synthase family protein [Antarcticibacterium flavum]|uniref:3-oxoacyl-[acyl-carrier-protein] synthase 1 n=1 Tax=Antarcticibacterium flavum TaxID=2058175 RepID=A0A5B7X0C2_9FLAO|nr:MULTISPECIES: beta-ketoacyl-[acyl-carrier-protein] synthase family protein [Antarcticibacterium]MCM4158877.1 beta-ketoacyl-ACP synthase [Antarcticibacterium sp. W02-3]QCY68132.1 beta-ketoacyl-[acyl-carrier-protein] synthase family protein [Antarcticibacterium flavum]